MVRLGIDEARELRHRAHTLRLAADFIEKDDELHYTTEVVQRLRSIAASWEYQAAMIETGPQ